MGTNRDLLRAAMTAANKALEAEMNAVTRLQGEQTQQLPSAPAFKAPTQAQRKVLGEGLSDVFEQMSKVKIEYVPIDTSASLPSTREIMARIANLASRDKNKASALYDQFMEFQQDPTNPYYSPYGTATNQNALRNLSQLLGEDLTGGVTDEWLERNRDLLGNARYTATGSSPAAPTKSSTAAQDAAYWYYQLLKDGDTTRQAESEWAALQAEIAALVRDPRSYSDEEILARIDPSKYGTLRRMDEGKAQGTPLALNRKIGYSEDGLYGAIWAARNGGSTGDSLADAVQYVLGVGNQYVPDEKARAARDPNSPDYNPNAFSTLYDLENRYGVETFDRAWLDANRGLLESVDEQAAKDYRRIEAAVGNWEGVQGQWKDLSSMIQGWVDDDYSDREIYDFLTDEAGRFDLLGKLEDARQTGQALDMAGGVDYSLAYVDGLIWAARNGGGTGDVRRDMEMYAAGKGNHYVPDPQSEAARVPGTDAYHPYLRATYKTDDSWDPEDTSWQADLVINPDTGKPKDPGKNATDAQRVAWDRYKAQGVMETTQQALSEQEKLWGKIAEWVAAGDSAEQIVKRVNRLLDVTGQDAQYPTLKKMETYRSEGGYLPLSAPVDFTLPRVAAEIEALVAQRDEAAVKAAAAEPAAEDAAMRDAYAQGDFWPTFLSGALQDEASENNRWIDLEQDLMQALRGEADVSPQAHAWMDRFGLLLSGDVLFEGGGGGTNVSIWDERERGFGRHGTLDVEGGLGKTALAALRATDSRYITTQEEVRLALQISQDIEAAQAQGLSLDAYYERTPEAMERVSGYDQLAAQREAEAMETAQAERERLVTENEALLDGALSAVSGGAATPEQQSLVEAVRGQNVEPYKQTDALYGRLSGEVSTMVSQTVHGFSAPASMGVTLLAMQPYEMDLRYATAVGLSLEEYYARHPERARNTEQVVEGAVAQFEEAWSAFGATAEGAQDTYEALLQEHAPTDAAGEEATGEGMGLLKAVGMGADRGWTSVQYGAGNALDAFILQQTDADLAARRRAGLSREDYRRIAEETITAMEDEEARALWAGRLEGIGDIYELGLNIPSERVQQWLREKQARIQAIDEFASKHATGTEKFALNATSAVTSNSILLAGTTAATLALGGGPVAAAVASSAIFGLPEGADLINDLTAQGVSLDAARRWGAGAAALVGVSESLTNVNFMPSAAKGNAGQFTRWLVDKGTENLFGANPRAAHRLANWVLNTGVRGTIYALEEGTQEYIQANLMSIYEDIAKGEPIRIPDQEEALNEALMGFVCSWFLMAQGMAVNSASNLVSNRMARRMAAGGDVFVVEDLADIANADMQDRQNPQIGTANEALAVEGREAALTREAVVDEGAMDAVLSGPEAQAAQTAREALDTAAADVQSARREIADAETVLRQRLHQFRQNATDAQATQATRDAQKEVASAKERFAAVFQKQQAAQADYETAQTTFEAAQMAVYGEVRALSSERVARALNEGLAREAVQAAQAAEQEAAVAAEAAAPADLDTVQAAAEIVREIYPDADPAQRAEYEAEVQARLQQRMGAEAAEAVEGADMEAAASSPVNTPLMRQLQARYGVRIQYDGAVRGRGMYDPSTETIYLNPALSGSDALQDVVMHELTHYTQAAEGYADYANAALQYKYRGDMRTLSQAIRAKQDAYARQGVTLDEAQARQEVVADLTGELFADPRAVEALVTEAPGMAQRILDKLKRMLSDLKAMLGGDAERSGTYRELANARDLFQRALVERARRTGAQADGQYSLAVLPDGTPYVIVDTDQERFEGLSVDEMRLEARNAILELFRGKQIGSPENQAIVNRRSAREFAYRMSAADADTFDAKMRSSTELDNLLAASTFITHAPDTGKHQDAAGGWDYYRTIFDVAGRMYEGVVNVKNTPDARVFVDVNQVREYAKADSNPITNKEISLGGSVGSGVADVTGQPGISPRTGLDGSPSTDIVGDAATDVNPDAQYSLEEADLDAAIDAYLKSRGMEMRGFNAQTAQQSPRLTQEEKLAARTSERAGYVPETLDEWMTQGRERVREMGYEQAKQAFYELSNPNSAQDVAFGNAVIEEARLREDSEYLDLILQYGEQGTSLGKGLSARRIFGRMTPAGAGIFAVQTAEKQRADRLNKMNASGRRGLERGIERNANEAAAKAGAKAGASVTDGAAHWDSRWQANLTAGQEALIDQYKLGKTRLAGLYYNRATTKQRMLEAILDASGMPYNRLVTQLEYMRRGLPVTTLADVHYIENQMRLYHEAGGEQGGRVAEMALGRANEAVGNIQPRTARQKRESYRKSAMLLNGRTIARNILSNVVNMPMEGASRMVGAGLDKLVSSVTGERTAGLTSMAEYGQAWKAFTDEVGRTVSDYWVDRVDTSQGGRYEQVGRRVYQNNIGELANQLTGFLMQIGDRPFWKRSYFRSIAEQQRLTGATEITQEMHEQAVQDANYTTFQEDNRVVNALQQLKNVEGFGTLVDYVIPFAKIPTNIVKRMYEYSPAGLVGTVIKQGLYEGMRKNGSFDQRKFVQGMARGLTGTGITALGYLLASAGIMGFGYGDEDDPDKGQLQRAQGEPYTLYLNIGDKNLDISWLTPFVFPLTMGANLYKALENDATLGDAVYSGLMGAGDMLFEQSFMSSMQNIMNGGTEGILLELPKSIASQNIPSIVRQIASAVDPYVRDTTDESKLQAAFNASVLHSLPGLRQTLPARIDATGQPFLNEGGVVPNLLLPFAIRTDRNDETLQALLDLAEETGRVDFLPGDALYGARSTLPGGARALTNEEKEQFKTELGVLRFEGGTTTDKTGAPVHILGLRALMESEAYQSADPERRADMVKAMNDAALLGVREEWLGMLGRTEKPQESEYSPKAQGGVPAYFVGQPDSYVMRSLNALYDATGDARYLPTSIATTFTVKGDGGKDVEVTVSPDQLEALYDCYMEALEAQLDVTDLEDEDMTAEERAQAAVNMMNRAKNRARKVFWVEYGG